MLTSRRTLVAGLAALPSIATTAALSAITTTGAASVDPILGAINRHRTALAALEAIDELAEPGRYAAAEAEIFASYDVLLATTPQTIAGARALVDFMIEDSADGDAVSLLKVLRRALDRLAVA